MPVSRDVAKWGMRLLLGAEPEDEEVLDFHRNGYESQEALRDAFMRTTEAQELFALANSKPSLGDNARNRYLIPPFLLRRPIFEDVPWRFSEPNLDAPVSQLCTFEQMQTQTYRDLCERLGVDASLQHRKHWEFTFILAGLESKGMLADGKRGLGFGVGLEPMPSVFAKAGAHIVASDAPFDLDFSENWAGAQQWSSSLNELWRQDLVSREVFFDQVEFRPADMNNIPEDLRDFDFCWSSCAFEHLGSVRLGLDYLHNSLETLKPGGVSVQTTEFNLTSNDLTAEVPGLCLFRKQDFELVMHELVSCGHTVEPLNLWPGATPVDEYVDLPPFSLPHLKLELQGYQTTSIGIIITKGTK